PLSSTLFPYTTLFRSFNRLRNLPVHDSMRAVSELIYQTCKTYLITQGKFILLLELFIGAVMVIYFGSLRHYTAERVAIITAPMKDRKSTRLNSSHVAI